MLSEAHWDCLAPLLPPQKPRTGRPSLDHRTFIEAVLWLAHTGAPWRDLPRRYGSWRTVYSRFRRWQQAGIFDRVLAALQRAGDAAGALDWSLHFVDRSIVRAHQHAAGARGALLPRRSVAAVAASRPRSTSVPSAAASRLSSP